jgi:Protein of unknown function (DUF3822)
MHQNARGKKRQQGTKFADLQFCALSLYCTPMKQVFKIGSSEELNPSQAVLLMEIGETHCCFAIFDYANQMMLQLDYYTADEKDRTDILHTVLDAHAELKQSFRQAIIGYYMPENILIPSKLYQYDQSQVMLEAMYEKDKKTIVTESIAEWQLYNAYCVPSSIHRLLERTYATGNFWHVYSIILKNGIQKQESGTLIVDFKTDTFCAVLTKGDSLLLAQIFSYTRSGDVLYWLLKICEQLSLSQAEVSVVLSGLIDKQSAVFKELYQYFLNVEFASVENDIRLSRDFEDYPAHFFSSLYKLASCVS